MARHAPGLPPSELERMTPRETAFVRERVEENVKAAADERLASVKVLALAASLGRLRL